MSGDPHQVTEHEHGLIRLFTTAMEPQVDAAITVQNVHRLLGANIEIDPEKTQVFPSQVIEGIGLSHYLIDAHGIRKEDLAGKSAALDALEGLIVIIPSSAFMTKPQTLDPNPALRFIGTFRETKGQGVRPMPTPDTAKGQTQPPETTFDPAPRARHYSWTVALGALLIAAALVLYLTF